MARRKDASSPQAPASSPAAPGSRKPAQPGYRTNFPVPGPNDRPRRPYLHIREYDPSPGGLPDGLAFRFMDDYRPLLGRDEGGNPEFGPSEWAVCCASPGYSGRWVHGATREEAIANWLAAGDMKE